VAYISDYSGDHAFIDGVETVTHTPIATGTGDSSVEALRGTVDQLPPTFSDSLAVMPDDVVFILWNVTLTATRVENKDQIKDSDNVVYQVRLARESSDGSQWVCVCRKQV